jgi:neutral trehalase
MLQWSDSKERFLNKKDFPKVHFYDQDFVDIYDRTWTWIQEFWFQPSKETGFGKEKVFQSPADTVLSQFDAIFASFFLVYSNRIYPAHSQLDALYARQEGSGAIRWKYSLETGKALLGPENPEGIGMPLFAWAEYNIYHKVANKKRVKDVLPVLQRYFAWVEATFKQENGLYCVPLCATTMDNSPRAKAKYLVDFNTAMAINALYMSALGDIMNDKEVSFQFKRAYFSIKTRVNSLMWDMDEGFYYDLDADQKQIKVKTIGSYWPLLAEIPNEDRAEKLIAHLTNQAEFGVEHPFPSLAANEKTYSPLGNGHNGSVFPPFTYMVIKGLEKYSRHELARECSIRHLYYLLDSLMPEGSKNATVWEAYKPQSDGPAAWPDKPGYPRAQHLASAGLSTIALMIENIVGLEISLPRKTVDWMIPSLEIMGIENLSLKRNMITILSNKLVRGWEIHMESEKLYYFTINIIGKKKKTLPIPSGKCSMLIDKL